MLKDLNVCSNKTTNVNFTNFTSTKLERINLIGNPIQTINIDSVMQLKTLEKLAISTNFLNTDMLDKLKNEKRRWKIMVIDTSREDEIAIFPQKAQISNVDRSTEITTSTSIPAVTDPITTNTPFVFNPSDDPKDAIISELLKRIQKFKLDHGDIKKSVDNLHTIVIFVVVTFSLFVLIQLAVFVKKNYDLCYRLIRNMFAKKMIPHKPNKISLVTSVRL